MVHADPCFWSLTDIAAAIRAKEISSVEVTQACLRRIDNISGTLNCFVRLDREEALANAQQADRELSEGRVLGCLHGVPLAHKDCFYRAGKTSSCGTPARVNFIADRTAAVLERIDAAGAIDLGTLHMAEWAFGATGHNEHLGPCRNPWNIERISGGSSSGSGAAVAARVVYASFGTDLGGSIRLPASFCGIVGIKPTTTRVSRYGILPMSFSLDHVGPLARTVRDCARLLTVVAGHDARDPTCSREPVPDYESALSAEIKGIRLAVPVESYLEDLSEEIRHVFDDTVKVFRTLGAKIVNVRLPDTEPIDALAHVVQMSEAAALHSKLLRNQPELYSAQVRQRIEPGFFIPAIRYLEALHLRSHHLTQFVRAAFSDADILLSPVISIETPTISQTDVKGTASMPEMISKMVRYTRYFSYLGLPCLCLPAGQLRNGMPVGVQLVAPPFQESTLFSAGHSFERATPWHDREPDTDQFGHS